MADLRAQLQATLGDCYSIERELGGGGMARVFVARDVTLGRDVVVKVIAPESAEGWSAERFERGAKLAAQFQQANIVPELSSSPHIAAILRRYNLDPANILLRQSAARP